MAQITKQGFLFVLDRETGAPLFPVEERAVPTSNLPGEEAWPTQPFPQVPEPYARQLITEADLTHYSEADHDSILQEFRSMRYQGLYTPPDLKRTLMIPGTRGGSNWGGTAYDPATTMLYIRSLDAPDIQTIVKVDPQEAAGLPIKDQGRRLYSTYCASCHGVDRKGIAANPSLIDLDQRMSRNMVMDKIKRGAGIMPPYAGVLKEGEIQAILAHVHSVEEGSDQLTTVEIDTTTEQVRDMYLNTSGYRTWTDPSGNPAIKPPWGMLHALNLSTGEYEWQIPLGNDEQYQKEGAPTTGLEGKAGPIVTAGDLVFIVVPRTGNSVLLKS